MEGVSEERAREFDVNKYDSVDPIITLRERP